MPCLDSFSFLQSRLAFTVTFCYIPGWAALVMQLRSVLGGELHYRQNASWNPRSCSFSTSVCGPRVCWIPRLGWCLVCLPSVREISPLAYSFCTLSFFSFETFGNLPMASWSDIPVCLFCQGSLNLGLQQSEGWVKEPIKSILSSAKAHASVLRVSSQVHTLAKTHWIVHWRSVPPYYFFCILPKTLKLHGIEEYESD